jgi:hypothetical protein
LVFFKALAALAGLTGEVGEADIVLSGGIKPALGAEKFAEPRLLLE